MDRFRNRLGALLAAAGCALACPAFAAESAPQIFKCTDASGNVTYQNEPCPKNAKAGRIDIFDNRWSATKEEREAEWRRNASQHKVAAGMPGRFVREALGEPTEVRDTQKAGAAQLWLYNLSDRSVEVGMLNDQVLWFQETPVSTPTARAAAAPDRSTATTSGAPAPESSAQASSSAPAPTAPRPAPDLPVTRVTPSAAERANAAAASDATPPANVARGPIETPRVATSTAPQNAAAPEAKPPDRGVARGQDCRQALASLGAPTRQRDVPALDTGSDPATEYFYDSTADGGRLRIVCANGRVEGVDRTVAR